MIRSAVDSLRLLGDPTLDHVDLDLVEQHRLADGGGFPPSYRRFVRHAGWARTFALWLIYPPVLPGFADGWQGRAATLTRHLRATYCEGEAEDFDWMVEPDGRWDLLADLEVFGWSENGDALLWELGSRGTDGELAVWESRSLDSLHRLGSSLDDALPLLQARATERSGPLTSDIEPLPAVRL